MYRRAEDGCIWDEQRWQVTYWAEELMLVAVSGLELCQWLTG